QPRPAGGLRAPAGQLARRAAAGGGDRGGRADRPVRGRGPGQPRVRAVHLVSAARAPRVRYLASPSTVACSLALATIGRSYSATYGFSSPGANGGGAYHTM